MSGHLQRMAASAARPERGVRPLVGNLFAKDESVEQSPALGMEQEVFEESSAARVPRRVETISASTKDAPERENREREEEHEERLPLVKKRAERLVGREESAVKERVEPLVAMPARTEESPERLVDIREAVRPIETHPRLVPRTPVHERIERVAKEPEEADEHESAERLTIQPIAESSAVERVQGVRELKRDSGRASEEIQIHIGRIEVIAVPVPRERASAPASGRRTESLDEYLRRTDRRAR